MNPIRLDYHFAFTMVLLKQILNLIQFLLRLYLVRNFKMLLKIFFFLIFLPLGSFLPLYNPLPKILINPRDCPLNACEVVKIFAEHLFNAKIFEAIHNENYRQNRDSTEEYLNVQQWERQRELEVRLLEVERRLRSVEQPIWKILGGSDDAWDKCTEGICRCHATIKSLSCWRSDLLHLPPLQVIPTNIVKMYGF